MCVRRNIKSYKLVTVVPCGLKETGEVRWDKETAVEANVYETAKKKISA